MERKNMTIVERQARNRSVPGLRDRRAFLTEAGKCGALFMGGTCIAATAHLESRSASAQGGPADAGRAVQEKAMMVRIFGVARRAPGLTRAEVRGKSFIPLLGYGSSVLREAMKSNDTRQPLIFIQNFVNDAAFGTEGQTECPALSDRDFVAEYAMGVGDTVVGSVSGEIAPLPPPAGQPGAAVAGRQGGAGAGQGQRRRPTLPEYGESGTDLPLATRQVLAQGTRPLAVAGREKGMHFVKMSSAVAVADQLKVWQALHAKALEATPAFAESLAGYEVLQRLPDTAPRQPSRCGGEMPVPDLVACFWSKTNRGAAQFPSYVRRWRQADQQAAIDHSASFFVLVEEWEVFINPTFIG